MSIKTVTFIAAAAITMTCIGCVPSDAEISQAMSESRREAYVDWKASRDRGDSKEVKVDGPLSLEDAIKLALQYNKLLQKQVQEREYTRGQRIAAYKVVLPNVTLDGNYTRVEKGRGNWDIDSYSMGVTVRQPVFQGQAIPAQLRQARFYTALTDENIRAAVQNLIQNVANNYYDVLLSQHLVETHREALVSAEAQYRMVSEKKKQETATDYDVLRAQVDVATYRAKMINEQNHVDTYRVQMLKNMGVSQDSEISFSDKLEFLPMRPVFERAVELASSNRPDLRQGELGIRIDREALRIARSAFWPSVSASFNQTWTDGWRSSQPGVRKDSFGRNPWRAGVNAEYYFGIDNIGNLRSAQATARQSEIELLDRQEEAMRQIRQEMNNLANAEEMVNALIVNQESAREALRLALVGYQAGVKTEVDVTDARKALTDVIGQYYTALSDHTKARLNLQIAMGVLGPSLVTDGAPLPPTVPIANIEEFAATDYEPPMPIPMPTADDGSPRQRERGVRGGDTAPPIRPRSEPEAPRATTGNPDQSRARTAPEPTTASVRPMLSRPTSSAPMLVMPPPVEAQTVAAAAPAPVQEPKEKPIFKVKVRSGGDAGPHLAQQK